MLCCNQTKLSYQQTWIGLANLFLKRFFLLAHKAKLNYTKISFVSNNQKYTNYKLCQACGNNKRVWVLIIRQQHSGQDAINKTQKRTIYQVKST